MLGVKPRNMLTQLGEPARLGFFTRTGLSTYKLNPPSASTLSTNLGHGLSVVIWDQ